MGASFLCAFTGIENLDLTNNSTAYIQSWLQVFKQDKTMIVKAASQAQKAVDFMLGVQFNESYGCTNYNTFVMRVKSDAKFSLLRSTFSEIIFH